MAARPARQWVLFGLALLATLLLTFTGLLLYAYDIFNEKADVSIPYKDFVSTPEKVKRGGYLFVLGCAWCHVDRKGRLGSHQIEVVPPWVGTIFVPNLSRDPLYGISALSDGELWLQLRENLTSNWRIQPLPVPATRLSDDDLEAIILFLRNDALMAAPVSQPSEASYYSTMGKLSSALFVAGRDRQWGSRQKDYPKSRGEYLASAVLNCMNCHSPGFFYLDPTQQYLGSSPKITSWADATLQAPALRGPKSLLRWYNERSFARVLRLGITPDNRLVKMPLIPSIRDEDVTALWRFFGEREPDPAFRPGANSDEPFPAEKYTRNVRPSDCSACHTTNMPAGTPAFADAHASPESQKSLYHKLRAATFPVTQPW